MKGWKRLLLFIVPYFFIVGFFQYIGVFVSGMDLNNESIQRTIEQDLIVAFFGLLGTVLVIFLFMRSIDKEPFLNLGLHCHNRWKDITIGIITGLMVMGIGYLFLIFLGLIEFTEAVFLSYEFILTLILFVFVAFTEEILFRGYVLRNLMDSVSKIIALAISALLFASLHFANPHMNWISYTNLFLAGIVLGIPYIYTRNLWFPIALHFSWNFFQSLFGFNVSGQESYSLINFTMTENNIINGGDFGFEGSILSLIIQLFLIYLVFVFFSKRKISIQ